MKIIGWLLATVAASLISATIGALLSERLQRVAAAVATKFSGPQKALGIDGRWSATFEIVDRQGHRREYTELIDLSSRLGTIVGRLPDHKINRQRRPNLTPHVLRVRGQLRDRRYFSGTWFHPEPSNPLHGAFHIILDTSARTMTGLWIGYDDRLNEVVSGKWDWQRVDAPSPALPDTSASPVSLTQGRTV